MVLDFKPWDLCVGSSFFPFTASQISGRIIIILYFIFFVKKLRIKKESNEGTLHKIICWADYVDHILLLLFYVVIINMYYVVMTNELKQLHNESIT